MAWKKRNQALGARYGGAEKGDDEVGCASTGTIGPASDAAPAPGRKDVKDRSGTISCTAGTVSVSKGLASATVGGTRGDQAKEDLAGF